MIDDRLREELNALVDGELDGAREAELRARIESDPALRAEYDRIRRVAELVRGVPPARANLAGDVLARIPARSGRILPWPWLGGLAAAAAAVLAFVLWPRDDEPAPQQWTEATGRVPAQPDAPVEKKADGGDAPGAALLEESKGAEHVRRADPEVRARDEDGAIAPESMEPQEKEEADAETASAPGSRKEQGESPRAKIGEPKGASRGATRPVDLLEHVEKRRTPLDEKQRAAYLRLVERLEAPKLAAHLRRVGGGRTLTLPPPAPESRGDEKSTATELKAPEAFVLEIVAADAADAGALRRALVRAFPRESNADAASGVMPAAFQAEGRDGKDMLVQFGWNATPEQLGTLVIWLERIGLRPTGPQGVRPGRLRVGGAPGAASPSPVPVKVRIRYAAEGDGSAATGRSDDD